MQHTFFAKLFNQAPTCSVAAEWPGLTNKTTSLVNAGVKSQSAGLAIDRVD